MADLDAAKVRSNKSVSAKHSLLFKIGSATVHQLQFVAPISYCVSASSFLLQMNKRSYLCIFILTMLSIGAPLVEF